jgi:hypothetical protein
MTRVREHFSSFREEEMDFNIQMGNKSSGTRDYYLSEGVRQDIHLYKCVVYIGDDKEPDINFDALGQGV